MSPHFALLTPIHGSERKGKPDSGSIDTGVSSGSGVLCSPNPQDPQPSVGKVAIPAPHCSLSCLSSVIHREVLESY
jgi:hypothetical protein